MVRLTKKKIFIIFGTVILAGGAAAGGVILYNTLVKKHADLGMSKAEVLKKLGDPDHTSEKGETWYYFESGIGKKFKEKDELEHSWNEANQIKAQTIGLEIETKHFESRTIEFDSDNKVVSYLYDSDTKYSYDGESFSSWANKELKEIKTTLKDDSQCYKVSENKGISRFALSNFEDKLSYEATFTDKSLLKVADQRSFSLEGPDKKNISLKCEFTKEIQIETKLNIQAYDSKVEVYYEPKQVAIEGDGLYNIGDEAHLKATAKAGYKIDGWYDHSDSTKSNILSDNNEYNPKIETFGRLSLDVWCSKELYTPLLSGDGKTITYGLYPQTNVNNSSLVSALNALTTPESNGWYFYEGNYYAKVSAYPYWSDCKFDNGTTIVSDTTYWFKCEPIVWNVLSNNSGEYYIVSSVLLDPHCYYNSTSTRTIDGQTIYPNNYKYSDIRTWLNTDFYNSAFALGNEHIQTTTVNNSASTTDSSSNSYACANTEDKVFLPSYQDYINSSYGFLTLTDSTDTRYCRTTDWARARGSYYTSSGSYQYSHYWTRSPSSGDHSTWVVDYDGTLHGIGVVFVTTFGVRPGLSIKIA